MSEELRASHPVAHLSPRALSRTAQVKAGAGGERPTGLWMGKTGVMPFDGLYVEEAMEWALNDFFDQGAGGSTSEWTKEKRRPAKKKSKKKTKKSEL